VALLPLQVLNPEVSRVAEELFDSLTEKGAEVLLDDRDERPGLKFKDADLLGLPFRITVSEKSVSKGQVELKLRGTRKMSMLPVETAAEEIIKLIQADGT
jgi:prolyl-tRNA synthetase